jgi:DNA-binding IclR family transcriptional regulator
VEDLTRGLGLKKSTIRVYLSVLEKRGLIWTGVRRRESVEL